MVDALASYRDTMRRRGRQARREQEQRRRRARTTARRVAEYLRRAYDVDRVVLFGSMADEVPLGPRSDIDLAVEGLEKEDYYVAVARVQDEGSPFQVDLVRIEQCPESLREIVRREGRDI